jgi:hypothetical protein
MSAINIKDVIIIAKNQAAIWKILTDINSWRLWSGVIDRAVIYGQVKPGTSFKCLADKWDFDCVIAEVISEAKFHCRGKTIGLDVVFQWELSGAEEETRVLLAAEIDGWMARFFGKRIRGGFEDAIFTWLYMLKSYSERGTPRSDDSRMARVSRRLSKRVFSYIHPFDLFRSNRRDKDDCNQA